ncbi:F-box protein At4g35733-like [Lotus japonicus]|uniref:F-box protein At4g35733-like n=1 Tax=Lotus japonicus TaxID=34305 RepID=UPI002584C914|nr:F-box protein At4g35733-like [Lotus japonicus]
MEQRDWANLEAFALDLILDKLEERIDHVWFGVVCKNWCSVAKLNHQNKQFRSSVLPMLMIRIRRPRRRRGFKTCLFSIPGNRVYPFRLPRMLSNKMIIICGSSQGWLATVYEASIRSRCANSSHVITLINPFKNVAPIALPPLLPLKEAVTRVVLSVDPLTNPNDYVIAVIHHNYHSCRLAFMRAGQKFWTKVEKSNLFYRDITFYKGLLYAVCSMNTIVSFNLYLFGRKKITPNIIYKDNENELTETPERVYIVESLEGDLWMVRRFPEGFDVYKLELDGQTGKVLQMLKLDNLGDNVLFVGDDSASTVVSFSCFSNSLQKDSIYYHDDHRHDPIIFDLDDPLDLRVYNVKEGRFIRHYPFNPSFRRVSPSLWILPPLQ